MKKVRFLAVLISCFFLPFVSLTTNAQTTDSGKDLKAVSYVLGLQFGALMKEQLILFDSSFDIESVLTGVSDALSENTPRLSEQEINDAVVAAQANLDKREKELVEQSKKEGDMFREKYAEQADVKTTASGLMYRVLNSGDSKKKPGPTDTVVVNYRGVLVDGTPFDSSYERGQPASFSLQGIIPGWTEGLQLMSVGSIWELVIPPELAYGEVGASPVIPPNATLIFEIELLDVQ